MAPPALTIRPAAFPADLEAVRALFREYEQGVDAAVCFQGFEQELAALAERYAPPDGCVLLALDGDVPVGCAALRRLDATTAEARRLWLRPSARGRGAGGALVLRLGEAARAAGYRAVRLETLPDRMETALALYRRLGFREIAPYPAHPVAGAVYMELALR
ncbi:GNAT family N-acetyltransferase [Anaeromyxobacter sp. Red801]|uniref:GNAT family N-acetyltransferase n=1 Tax=Anaeromyxobacter sp. Red801 TaxID=3411632 RepID=UPI003BA18E11